MSALGNHLSKGESLEILDSYVQELSQSGEINHLHHANKLRSYMNILKDQEFAKELKKLFNEIFDLIEQKHQSLKLKGRGRIKSLLSTEEKILNYQSIGKSLDLINDLFAFRFILYGKEENVDLIFHCYKLAEEIIELFASKGYNACEATPLIGASTENPTNTFYNNFKYRDSVKDYICFPKENGYQSLHIVFVDDKGRKFEVQIRTLAMHIVAEQKGANHSKYKEETCGRFYFDKRAIKAYGFSYYSKEEQALDYFKLLLKDNQECFKEIENLLVSPLNDSITMQIISLIKDLYDSRQLKEIEFTISSFEDNVMDYSGIVRPLRIFERQSLSLI